MKNALANLTDNVDGLRDSVHGLQSRVHVLETASPTSASAAPSASASGYYYYSGSCRLSNDLETAHGLMLVEGLVVLFLGRYAS